jgi:HEAT repeat protein
LASRPETKAALFAVIEHPPIETGNEPEETKMNAEQGWRSAADAAARSLRRFGPEIIEELIPLLSPMNASQRSPAITALASLGPPAVPRLIELLGHEDRAVAVSASVALREIGPRAALALAKAVRTGNVRSPIKRIAALVDRPRSQGRAPSLLEVAGSKDRSDATRVAALEPRSKLTPKQRFARHRVHSSGGSFEFWKGVVQAPAWAAETVSRYWHR